MCTLSHLYPPYKFAALDPAGPVRAADRGVGRCFDLSASLGSILSRETHLLPRSALKCRRPSLDSLVLTLLLVGLHLYGTRMYAAVGGG